MACGEGQRTGGFGAVGKAALAPVRLLLQGRRGREGVGECEGLAPAEERRVGPGCAAWVVHGRLVAGAAGRQLGWRKRSRPTSLVRL